MDPFRACEAYQSLSESSFTIRIWHLLQFDIQQLVHTSWKAEHNITYIRCNQPIFKLYSLYPMLCQSFIPISPIQLLGVNSSSGYHECHNAIMPRSSNALMCFKCSHVQTTQCKPYVRNHNQYTFRLFLTNYSYSLIIQIQSISSHTASIFIIAFVFCWIIESRLLSILAL